MIYFLFVFTAIYPILNVKCTVQNTNSNKLNKCNIICPPADDEMQCGFEPESKKYKAFASKCAMTSYAECNQLGFIKTPMKFCIENLVDSARRFTEQSCPVFCPTHYRPVCGASKIRSYNYRSFNNRCYLDMLNCRGNEDSGYVEVPLYFCQRHGMKNIFKEKVVVSGFDDYKDYYEY